MCTILLTHFCCFACAVQLYVDVTAKSGLARASYVFNKQQVGWLLLPAAKQASFGADHSKAHRSVPAGRGSCYWPLPVSMLHAATPSSAHGSRGGMLSWGSMLQPCCVLVPSEVGCAVLCYDLLPQVMVKPFVIRPAVQAQYFEVRANGVMLLVKHHETPPRMGPITSAGPTGLLHVHACSSTLHRVPTPHTKPQHSHLFATAPTPFDTQLLPSAPLAACIAPCRCASRWMCGR